MTFPIAERELRVAARSSRVFRGRLIVTFIFGAISAWMLWFASKTGPNMNIAAQTFSLVTHSALILCAFCATATADAISSEKRNGTLGLLFLTDLKARDIVFGKLASSGLVSFFSLVAIIPVIS